MAGALFIAITGIAALIAGILIGRYYVPDNRAIKRAARHGKAYARGLSALLAKDVERCVDELRGVVEENVSDVEPYFALGALFRTRGEHERAIRVHQTIAVRQDANKATKNRAHYELGLDFRAAGFPRRAAKALEEVIAEEAKNEGATRALAALYEETGHWERATKAWRRLGKLTKSETGPREAHLLAEAARAALRGGDPDHAKRMLKEAQGREKMSPHVLSVQAELARARGDARAAADAYANALVAAPDLAAHFAPKLLDAAEAHGEPERLGTVLELALEKHADNQHLRLALARYETARDVELAEKLLRELLTDAPGLLSARTELARIVIARGEPPAILTEYQALVDAARAADRTSFRCSGCSYATVELFWRCPSCRRWDTAGVAWGRRAGEVTPAEAAEAELRATGSAFVFGRPRLLSQAQKIARDPGQAAPHDAPDAGIFEGSSAPMPALPEAEVKVKQPGLFGRMKSWFMRKVPAEETLDEPERRPTRREAPRSLPEADLDLPPLELATPSDPSLPAASVPVGDSNITITKPAAPPAAASLPAASVAVAAPAAASVGDSNITITKPAAEPSVVVAPGDKDGG